MNLNPFIVAVALLQFGGAVFYHIHNDSAMAILYFLYGLTNINILFLQGVHSW